MSAEDLLRQLAEKGGYIVSTAALSQMEIAFASAEERMVVLSDGLGFVRRPAGAAAPRETPANA